MGGRKITPKITLLYRTDVPYNGMVGAFVRVRPAACLRREAASYRLEALSMRMAVVI